MSTVRKFHQFYITSTSSFNWTEEKKISLILVPTKIPQLDGIDFRNYFDVEP